MHRYYKHSQITEISFLSHSQINTILQTYSYSFCSNHSTFNSIHSILFIHSVCERSNNTSPDNIASYVTHPGISILKDFKSYE